MNHTILLAQSILAELLAEPVFAQSVFPELPAYFQQLDVLRRAEGLDVRCGGPA